MSIWHRFRYGLTAIVLLSPTALPAVGGEGVPCPAIRMEVEQLPTLNEPRSGHVTLCVGDEVVVMGGHTSGFLPLSSAEYYSDDAWQPMKMVYQHDQGLLFSMKSGEIVIAGGHQQELGIGQTFPLELYDPATHEFRGYGCLDKKRCFAQGIELDSGRVYIAGNWYHDDAIECFDGSRQCLYVKEVAQHRSMPYMLRTARDNAIIFSSCDNHGDRFDTIVVDRLHGDPFTVPLFETWRPFYNQICFLSDQGFIGDEAKGDYTYLIPVVGHDDQLAIAKVEGEQFSLLATSCPIPMKSQWGHINWGGSIIANRQAGQAYIMGAGDSSDNRRFYVLSIDYRRSPALLKLYYSDQQEVVGIGAPVLTPDGNLVMAGGFSLAAPNNFEPHGYVWRLLLSPADTAQRTAERWAWLAALLFITIAVATTGLLLWRRRKVSEESAETPESIETSIADKELMERIVLLMSEEQLFLNPNLRVSDVAAKLNSNSNYVSTCINVQEGCSFNQYVNGFRINYAKQLLSQNPDMKLSNVSTASGFTTESSFFRNFKLLTGKTPNEWRLEIEQCKTKT